MVVPTRNPDNTNGLRSLVIVLRIPMLQLGWREESALVCG